MGIGTVSAQCTIDPTDTAVFSPRIDSLPCVVRTVAYNQVVQMKMPASIDLQQFGFPISFVLTVDSVVIDSVTGQPSGITYALNPTNGHFMGGANACALISGTTTDAPGSYPLLFHGRMALHGMAFPPYFSGDTVVDLATVQASPQNPFSAAMEVINQGDQCRPVASGIKNFNSELNAAIAVYPNPNNGVFEFKINAGGRVNGDLMIIDVTGKTVYSQKLDVMGMYSTTINLSTYARGLYTLQIRTADGFASKNISVE
jgi:hypothetical protein